MPASVLAACFPRGNRRVPVVQRLDSPCCRSVPNKKKPKTFHSNTSALTTTPPRNNNRLVNIKITLPWKLNRKQLFPNLTYPSCLPFSRRQLTLLTRERQSLSDKQWTKSNYSQGQADFDCDYWQEQHTTHNHKVILWRRQGNKIVG